MADTHSICLYWNITLIATFQEAAKAQWYAKNEGLVYGKI